MNKKYVVFKSRNSYSNYLINDLIYNQNVEFSTIPKHFLKLYYIHTSRKLNKFFHFPFQFIWYPSLTKKIDLYEKICLFIEGNPQGYDCKFLKKLKKKYNCKLVFYCLNTCVTIGKKQIDIINKYYDYVFSFDYNDCVDQGWIHYNTFYSQVKCDKNNNSIDVFFVGKHKGRLKLLHNFYKLFTEMGLKCLFYIIGVDDNEKEFESIHYNQRLKYDDVVGYVKNSKCILEIVSEGQIGVTLRVCEAICCEKKLLTTNIEFKNNELYDEGYVKIIDTNKIDNSINLFINSKNEFDYSNLKEVISPNRFIDFIDNLVLTGKNK